MSEFQHRLSIDSTFDFNEKALELFRLQAQNNNVYKRYLELLKFDVDQVSSVEEIPFLPIDTFKKHRVTTGSFQEEVIFESSGTTQGDTSKNYLPSLLDYKEVIKRNFIEFYGEPTDFCFLCLLPSYLERGNSSLVYMCQELIELSGQKESGFYLNEFDKLHRTLIALRESGKRVLLIGVTFALLDFAQQYSIDFPELIVMETGGMKGRRKEMTRSEVHNELMPAFNVTQIHSEYGMTELMSQCYSSGEGWFASPPWMGVRIRPLNDPFGPFLTGTSGIVEIIDLMNVHSCAFIKTSDLGKVRNDGSFQILGRVDYADARGCNLMYS